MTRLSLFTAMAESPLASRLPPNNRRSPTGR